MAISAASRWKVSQSVIFVGISAVFLGLRAGPLHGTVLALILSGALVIGLTGYLTARAVGLLTNRQLFVQVATVITCGFVVALLLGSLFRFMGWPITSYIAALHVIMLMLALLPSRRPIPRPKFPMFGISLTLIVCTGALVVMAAAATSFAYAGEFSDRGYFASVNHWLLTTNGSADGTGPIIGLGAETRLRLDGLTLFSVSLEYSSGISASDYHWHLQPLLLIALLPVVVFALVYRITRCQRTAALAVALLTVLTAQTFHYTAYELMAGFTGRHPVLDLRTLREVGLAILLPMSLFAFVTALRRRAWNWGLLMVGSLLMLVATHLTAALVFILLVPVVSAAQYRPQRFRLNWRCGLIGGVAGVLMLVIIGLLLLTLRERIPGLLAPVAAEVVCNDPTANSFVQFVDLPGIGLTYILSPTRILAYHPLVLLALVLTLLLIKRRQRFAVGYLLAPLGLISIMVFFPPIVHLLTISTGVNFLIGNPCTVNDLFIGNVVANLSAALTFTFNIPVVIAISLGEMLRRWRTLRRLSVWLTPVAVCLTLIVSATEPFPIPFSLREQMQIMHDTLSHLDTQPAELNLTNALNRQLDPSRTWRILAPDEVGSAIIQRVPNVLLVSEYGGTFWESAIRFFGGDSEPAPLLDVRDIELLQLAQIDLVVLPLRDTRLPQFLLDLERFDLLMSESSFLVFKVAEQLEHKEHDIWFSDLNEFYAEHFDTTWQTSGWSEFTSQPVTDQDSEALTQFGTALPPSLLREYGLAWLAAVRGQTAQADIARLQNLMSLQPLLGGLYAWTQPPEQAAQLLLAALDNPSADVQLLAARELLTQRYIYLLSLDDLHHIISRIEQSADAWNNLTRDDLIALKLKRIELLMARGVWSTVVDWINQLPPLQIHSSTHAMQALAWLAQGDTTNALTHLARTIDPDWLWPRQRLHPDRWEDNTAGQLYWILQGNLAERDGRVEAARTAYAQAIEVGDRWAARVWLAQLDGNASELSELDQEWRVEYGPPLPEFVSLLTLAESGQIAVNHTQIGRDDNEQTLSVSTLFGSPYARQFPPRFLRYDLRTEEEVLVQVDVPTVAVNGTLLRQTVDLPVEEVLPELTQARLFVQSRHDTRVVWGGTITALTLARPEPADVPAAAHSLNAVALDALRLTHVNLQTDEQTLNLTLYWTISQPLEVDYQLSVRVLNEAGETVVQRDSAPVNGLYPMSQWRVGVPIADMYQLELPEELSIGRYLVVVTAYSLDTLTSLTFRLPNGEGTELIQVGSFVR